MKFIFLSSMLLLCSCATPYQKSGWRGGYTDTQLARDMYEVHFKGNGYTDSQTVHKYLLRRCAEVTQESGFTHFLQVSSDKNTNHSYTSSYNSFTNHVSTYESSEHENSMVIKLLSNPDPKAPAYDALIILGNNVKPDRLPAWND